MALRIREVATVLDETYGDPGWWPAETPFEVAVGAVLTQNTAWTNVEKAVAGLRRNEALGPTPIHELDEGLLRELIRPSGYFRQKAARLKRLSGWWLERLGPSPDAAPDTDERTSALRAELLAIKGIGPETADSILLYAFHRPVFVVDAYTGRLAIRLGLMVPPFGYDELQSRFIEDLPQSTELYNRLHAQIVLHAKALCTKRNPACSRCPLYSDCQGPVDLDAGP